MKSFLPDYINPDPWMAAAEQATDAEVRRALVCDQPGIRELAVLLSAQADQHLEAMAQRAQTLTRRHFGRTIALYVPLYLSDYCTGGCSYCGFAADRRHPRRRLESAEIIAELDALKSLGFDEILLLTGERTVHADFTYVLEAVRIAATRFSWVMIETFPMEVAEYRELAKAGCVGVTIYQETYDADVYAQVHRWGPKRDLQYRFDTPRRALEAGLRAVGMGVLIGLAHPVRDALCLFQQISALRQQYWQAGFSVSFPRIRPQEGNYQPAFVVDDRSLARLIYAFRICLPEFPLTLSTREAARFRDGVAGIGISKMSAASRTTVGGYREDGTPSTGQFEVSDTRSAEAFCAALRRQGLDPVFKQWDAVYR